MSNEALIPASSQDEGEKVKIKVITANIEETRDLKGQWYFMIKYRTLDGETHLGFGSYDYANVLNWLKTEFEFVALSPQADIVEVIRCKNCAYLKKNPCVYDSDFCIKHSFDVYSEEFYCRDGWRKK